MKNTRLITLAAILLCASASEAFAYNSTTAVAYAEQWWNGRNPDYHDYSESGGDCANFVSQCLIAGGLDLSGYGTDSHGCLTTCTNLHSYLTNYPGVTWEIRFEADAEPTWFLPGDPAIFGYSDAHPRE